MKSTHTAFGRLFQQCRQFQTNNFCKQRTLIRYFSSGEGFRAWCIDASKGELRHRAINRYHDVRELPCQDPDANVLVRVCYSDLNYKDAMILKGYSGVVKKYPIVPGIDLAGIVEESQSPMFSPGDEVVLTGNKIGQYFDGGYSQFCKVQAPWLVHRPPSFTLQQCMVIGSAGFTAMQMIMHLEKFGNLCTQKGPVLVTGAAGGVGSTAVALLAKLGYEVVASSSRAEQLENYLKSLGATTVIGRLSEDGRNQPLQKQRWAAVVDTVGGPVLAAALAQTKMQGSVACVGVAAGGTLDTTVYPFILRGIRLLGIDATLPWNVAGYDTDPAVWEANRQERLEIWSRLEQDLTSHATELMHSKLSTLDELPEWADRILAGRVQGRVVVKI